MEQGMLAEGRGFNPAESGLPLDLAVPRRERGLKTVRLRRGMKGILRAARDGTVKTVPFRPPAGVFVNNPG
jgi:hypothetical protein